MVDRSPLFLVALKTKVRQTCHDEPLKAFLNTLPFTIPPVQPLRLAIKEISSFSVKDAFPFLYKHQNLW